MSVPVLNYFPIHGRAFAVRAALRYAKVPFTDKRVKFADFKEHVKPDVNQAPLGSLPTLEIPGEGVFCQSAALARWAARKSDLYPKDDIEILLVDEMIDSVNEMQSKCPQHKDPEIKKKLREEFLVGDLPKFLGFIARKLEKNGGPFLLGKKLSIADLFIFGQLNAICTGDWDYIPKDVIEKNYPSLYKTYLVLKEHPIIASELEVK